jgi:hypothetical protein
LFVGNERVDQLAAERAKMPFLWAQELWGRDGFPECSGAPQRRATRRFPDTA